MQNDRPVIVIVGPTASGKSAFAMDVARKYNGEIVCADSRTIYVGMDIGTAKPSTADQSEIRHHLLDIVLPSQNFSAAQFQSMASVAIKNIHKRGKLPIIVGGTGLYIDALIFDYQFGPPADPELRDKLNKMSLQDLQHMCSYKNIDLPINIKNKRHLVRSIELGGFIKKQSEIKKNMLVVGITSDREEIKSRITARAQNMFNAGVVDEARRLAKTYGWEPQSMTGNIYRVLRDVIANTKSTEQAIDEFIRSDMLLVKRQLTWFKRNKAIIWGATADLEAVIDGFIDKTLQQLSTKE